MKIDKLPWWVFVAFGCFSAVYAGLWHGHDSLREQFGLGGMFLNVVAFGIAWYNQKVKGK
jgi:hypothetical protein